jgi:hypothetical protein
MGQALFGTQARALRRAERGGRVMVEQPIQHPERRRHEQVGVERREDALPVHRAAPERVLDQEHHREQARHRPEELARGEERRRPEHAGRQAHGQERGGEPDQRAHPLADLHAGHRGPQGHGEEHLDHVLVGRNHREQRMPDEGREQRDEEHAEAVADVARPERARDGHAGLVSPGPGAGARTGPSSRERRPPPRALGSRRGA